MPTQGKPGVRGRTEKGKGKKRTCPKGTTWSNSHNECRWPDDEERQTAR